MMVSICCYINTIWTDLPRNLLHNENVIMGHIRRLIFVITTSRALDLKIVRIGSHCDDNNY